MTSTVDTIHPGPPPDRGTVPVTLEFKRNCSRVTIDASAGMDRLCRTSFTGPAPRLSEHLKAITIEYRLVTPAGWLRAARRDTSVTLAAEHPWEIAIGGGVAHLGVHLTQAEIRAFEIVRPGDAAVRLRVGGGARRLAFDDQRYGAIGGALVLDTPGAADAGDRYEIEIAGGVSDLTVGAQARVSLVS